MAVGIRDVALRAGVSVGTVSNVLNQSAKVAPASVARVHAAIEELGYVRNGAARQLRAGRSTSVGFVVLDSRNPFFTDLARGAELEAQSRGLSVLLGNGDSDSAREAALLDLFEEQRVLGVLISPYLEVGERLRTLRRRGTPAVLVDRRSELPEFGSVSVDDVAGGRLAVEHLLATGRRRIAFLGGPLGVRQVADRLAGAREAVAAHGDAELEVIETAASQLADGRSAGELLAARAPGARPDAVFAANDLLALGVLQGVHGTLAVPEQLALIGFDDIDFAAAAVVPLSSIRQPAIEMGRTALRMLLAVADDPEAPIERVVFAPELVARASTARAEAG